MRDLQIRLAEARRLSDDLFAMLSPEALYDRPIPERHRFIFYLGHLEAFDWNLLSPRLTGLRSPNEEFDRLFAFGIDPTGGSLPRDHPEDWPKKRAVESYRRRVRTRLDDAIAPTDDDWNLRVNVAVEHRLMHAETMAYMLHQLPYDRKHARTQAAARKSGPVRQGMVEVPEGPVTLGLSRKEPFFGWDNEFDAQTVTVPAFEIDEFKTTNAEYLHFVETGGYENRKLWSEPGWCWKSRFQVQHPVFWKRSAEGWQYRGMFEERPLPLDWPVFVSHAEASAYARWVAKELPTEAEWQRAAAGTPQSSNPLDRWDPEPVHGTKAQSAFGVKGMYENGWEWTSTPFAPFPGFEPFPFYEAYSRAFFDGNHFVLKGGSPRTHSTLLRPTFRNWFQPHYPYMYAGFRCVRH